MTRVTLALSLLLLPLPALTAPYDEMDYGNFLSATYQVSWPKNNVVYRGVAVRFHAPLEGEPVPPPPEPDPKSKKPAPKFDPAQVGVLYDTEMCRYAVYWHGGFINYNGVAFSGGHGGNPAPQGKILAGTNDGPGWGKKGDFEDRRGYPHGPLPREQTRHHGIVRLEKGVAFQSTVGGKFVIDLPEIEVVQSTRWFSRTLQTHAKHETMSAVVTDFHGAEITLGPKGTAVLEKGDAVLFARLDGTREAKFEARENGRLVVHIHGEQEWAAVKVSLWAGSKADLAKAQEAAAKIPPSQRIRSYQEQGIGTQWKESVQTVGVRGEDKQAYVVDQIAVPFKNPYKSWMRIGGVDFFSDGRAAISTWSGDVWIVSGLDDKLEKVTWKRYAAGLFQALGLKIVGDDVYVLGRDQITKLVDVNKDGEADYYLCFNNDSYVTANFHEFTFELQTDPEGNFYFIKGGPVRPGGSGWDKITPHHGAIMKVSKNGEKSEVVARGFRAPNGIGMSPTGQLTTGDNEGTWTPACPINWIKPGGFYGVPEFADKKPMPTVRDNPLCWLPKSLDNSNGGQVWITGDKFGPLSGQLLHMSYGTCNLYGVLKEEAAGQMQGGVFPLLSFDSGVCRARFVDSQNALYLVGLRGWQTRASKDGGFYRVRYTGKNAYQPTALKVVPDGVQITFSEPLDKSFATDVDNYALEQWNYRWTSGYGSAMYMVSDPKKQGKDEVEVDSATVSPDGKTVTLKIADLRPVMQMKIGYNLRAADGQMVKGAIHNTINAVGQYRGEVHPGEFKVVTVK